MEPIRVQMFRGGGTKDSVNETSRMNSVCVERTSATYLVTTFDWSANVDRRANQHVNSGELTYGGQKEPETNIFKSRTSSFLYFDSRKVVTFSLFQHNAFFIVSFYSVG